MTYMKQMKNEECNNALKRLFSNINISEICKFIDNVEYLSITRKDFYKKIYKKGIFDETTSYCVGISFNEYVKDIEISNRVVDIQEFIEIDENQAFIWSVRDINLKTVDFNDIQ